jgi:predicted amidohydrolase
MHKVKITLAQISEQKNLFKIEEIIRENKNSDIIVFPEAILKTDSLKIIKKLQNITKKYSLIIIIGIIYEKRKRLYNYAYYLSPKKIRRYQKIHVHWTEKYIPGRKFRIIKTPFGKVGLLICYDSSFQESGRILALKGAKIIVILSTISSNFPYKINLIRTQSIALNNQIYVIESCKSGKRFTGHSSIYDPYGKELINLGKYESIKTKTIDLNLINKWRKKEKIFSYRKPKLYKKISSKEKFS